MAETQIASDVQQLTESLGQFPDPLANPAFVVVSGLPGTGKSYFSSKLAERLPFLVVESDTLRKTLFPSPAYTPWENSRLFQAIHSLIKVLLKRGIPIIFDATNLSERYRERLYNIADCLNVKLVLVRIEAPPDVVRKRLAARAEGMDSESNSGADWTVFQRMKPMVQKIRRNHYAIDTSRDITPVLDKIVRAVNR